MVRASVAKNSDSSRSNYQWTMYKTKSSAAHYQPSIISHLLFIPPSDVQFADELHRRMVSTRHLEFASPYLVDVRIYREACDWFNDLEEQDD
jgi:hypothetical protein